MERRALVAVVISVAILLLYQEFILKRFYKPPAPSETAEEAAPPPREKVPPPASEAPPPVAEAPPSKHGPAVTGAEVTVETDLYKAVFTSAGGRLLSLQLKNYRTEKKRSSPPLDMVVAGPNGELPLGIELTLGKNKVVTDDDVTYEIRGGPLHLSGDQKGTLALVWHSGDVTLEKQLEFSGDSYPIEINLIPTKIPAGTEEIGLSWVRQVDPGNPTRYEGAITLLDKKIVRKSLKDLEKGEVLSGVVGWTGYADQYFFSALVPQKPVDDRVWLKLRDRTIEVRLLARPDDAKPIPLEMYVGPKDFDVLEKIDHDLARAIDFGWFSFIAVPMLRVLKLSHTVTGNYGIDIILLTLAIKILFIPLTQKSFKSMKDMQKLQPQMAKLRERLKDKPEEMNREIMDLYRRHKVNPLGGCLPMILQIPVFLGLYNALLNSIELRHARFALWINDLSQPDRLGHMVLPFVHPPGIPVLTLVMGVTMFGQQWMTPTTGDPTQQKMMMVMPLIFTFMFINFPSGLVLYWLVNNILTIAQQYYITRTAK